MEENLGNHKLSGEPPNAADPNRQWWQLNMAQVKQRATYLAWPGHRDYRPPTALDWNDRGMLEFGGMEIPREEIERLLFELRRRITDKGLPVSQLPDMDCVRLGIAQDEICSGLLIVDVDLGEFILPVAADEEAIRNERSLSDLAAGMAGVIEWVDGERDEILERELKFREIVRDAASNSAGGMVPLWLRMRPWEPSVIHLADPEYSLITLELDEDLIWSLNERGVDHEARLLGYVENAETLQRRSAAKAVIERTGFGLVCNVALALMDEHALSPTQIFADLHQARICERVEKCGASLALMNQYRMTGRQVFEDMHGARLAERPGSLDITSDGAREILFLRDGVVQLMIEFDGGSYLSGSLKLFGEYPLSVEISSKGRKLNEVVEHPAFKRAGVVISECRSSKAGLNLLHEFRTTLISEAMNGWR
jgi:hypothetical protein